MQPARIVSRRDRPELFAAWEASAAFAAGERHPVHGRFGRQYYPATFACRDLSFAVVRNDEPLLLARCNLLDGLLGYFGMPIRLVLSHDAADEASGFAVRDACAALDELARASGASAVVLRDDEGAPEAPALGRAAAGFGATAETRLTGTCDLHLDEAAIRRHLRKSYHSLVNWGRRNLRLVYVNQANPAPDLYGSYRDFHARVAGRVTRPPESWEAMYRWIVAGGGELALAYLDDGALVAATVSVDGSEITYYASGVYDRERFDRPLAHWPLFDAIQRSRARGLCQFDLGDLPEKGTAGDKEFNIGYFKRGFATAIPTHRVWRWTIR
ncbi:MAG TPA: hypothetical protein VMU42_15690 [Candidatus Sulfotelmatobacter sp.]|nr:hypothetical protein [Candidatus Sulfotelmatobacter sp.]